MSCSAHSPRRDHLLQQTKSWDPSLNGKATDKLQGEPQTHAIRASIAEKSRPVCLYRCVFTVCASAWHKGCGCYGDQQWKLSIKVIIRSKQDTMLLCPTKMMPGGGASHSVLPPIKDFKRRLILRLFLRLHPCDQSTNIKKRKEKKKTLSYNYFDPQR